MIFIGIAANFALSHSYGNIIAAGIRVWDTTAYGDATRKYLDQLLSMLSISGNAAEDASSFDLFVPHIESHVSSKRALKNPGWRGILAETWSCWRHDDLPCGECAPCVTRKRFLDNPDLFD